MKTGNLNRITKALRCGFRLKCPKCEQGALYKKYFSMFSHCTQCQMKFEREQGYFIGAMYLNYGATVIIAFPGYLLLTTFTAIPFLLNFGVWSAFSAIFPIFFYRYSKSLWLSFDWILNPL